MSEVAIRPPHAVFCETYTACHAMYSTRTGWSASEIMRVSLSLYLVRQGFRTGYYLPGGPWGGELTLFAASLPPLHARAGSGGLVIVNDRVPLDLLNPTGSIFPPSDDGGSINWICSAGGIDLELWSEPLPTGATYDKIAPQLQRLKDLLGHLGYTAHARIE